MKKLLLAILISIVSIGAYAQAPGWTSNATGCFCCNGIYNLPTPPVITGPTSVGCGDSAKYCINPCPGSQITWVVTPSTAFTGQGTACITLTAPLSASFYSIVVHIKCGNKEVEGRVGVKVNIVQNCTANFLATITMLPNGFLNINTVPDTKTGAEHYWGIVYNGTYPNCTVPCVSIPLATISTGGTFGAHETATGIFSAVGLGSGKTAGTSGYGINYSGFPNNSCFKITHYINCCGIWYRQTQCVSMGSTNLRSATPGSVAPSITKTEVEQVDKKDLPKELKTD